MHSLEAPTYREDSPKGTPSVVSSEVPDKTAAAGRLQQMDGLRGIAMLFVFVGHFAGVWSQMAHTSGSANFFLRLVAADATFGSSFFMLLSGFFAYGSLMRGKKGFGEFLRGRIWRLYPLYLIMTLVYIVGSVVFPKMSKLPAGHYEAAIFILQTLFFLPGFLHIAPLMDVAWTLSFVIYFYVIEGALAYLFRLWGVSRLSRFLLLTSAGVLWVLVGDFTAWWQSRTAVFWVGMALSEAIGGMSGERLLLATRLTAPAAALTIFGIWFRTHLMLNTRAADMESVLRWRVAITAVTLFAFVWVAYFGPQWWKRRLSGVQLRQLGAASYSFYLTHGFAVKAFRYGIIPWLGSAADQPLALWVCQILGLALSIGIARVAYVLVERPLSKLVSAPISGQPEAARRPDNFVMSQVIQR